MRSLSKALAAGMLVGLSLTRVGSAESVDDVFGEATRAFAEKRYEDALRLHNQAWRLKQSYRTAAGLGQVELQLGRYRDAAEHLDYCLRLYPANADPEARRNIQDGYDEAVRHVAALQIVVEPDDARVRVGERDIGQGPFSLVFVEPGRLEVEAARDGYRSDFQTIRATAGSTRQISIRLRPDEEPGLGAPGASDAGARAGEVDTVASVDGDEGPSGKTIVVASGAVLTLAAIGAGVGFSIKASGHDSDADVLLSEAESRYGASPCRSGAASRPICGDIADTLDDYNTSLKMRDVSFVAAGVLGVATVATSLLWPETKSKPAKTAVRSPRWSLEPWAHPNGGGASVRGAF